MSAGRVFVDTNILVYAHDRGAGSKHDAARRKLAVLWRAPGAVSVSVQVLQELYVTLLRKRIPKRHALATIEDHLQWHVIENTADLLMAGIRLHQRQDLSFWDALVVAAAVEAGAAELWSEDFVAGQTYDGVKVVNPLMG